MINALKRNIFLTILIPLSILVLLLIWTISFVQINTLRNYNDRILESTLTGIPLQEESIFEQNQQSRPNYPNTFVVTENILSNQAIARSKNWVFDSAVLNQLLHEARATGQTKGTIMNNKIGYQYTLESNGNITTAFIDLTSYHQQKNMYIMIGFIGSILGLGLVSIISQLLSKRLIKPVEQSINTQAQFMADASHELKNPLQVLKNNVSILKQNKEDSIDKNMTWIDNQSDEIDRMSTIVNELLWLSQPQNVLQKEKETIVLSSLVNNEILIMEPLYFEENKVLNSDVKEGVITQGVKDEITRLVRILLDNALKYSLDNSIINVTLTNKNLSVTNETDSISDDDLSHLFDRFYRVDKSRSRQLGSSGLGLSIAKKIVEDHKWQIKTTYHQGQIVFSVIFN